MKKETKELVEFIKDCILRYQTEFKRGEVDIGMIDEKKEDKTCDKAITFLDSLPKIESHLCRGGYIQDKNGTPCCDGDKVKFKFIESWYEDNFKDRYTPVVEGVLKFCQETKKFYIQFGPYHNGYDWLDWSTDGDGCEWFEKVNK